MQGNVKAILETSKRMAIEAAQHAVHGRVRINVFSPVDTALQRRVDMRLWHAVYLLIGEGVSSAVIDTVKEIIDKD